MMVRLIALTLEKKMPQWKFQFHDGSIDSCIATGYIIVKFRFNSMMVRLIVVDFERTVAKAK